VRLHVSSRTALGDEAILRSYILPVLGHRQLRSLQPADVEREYRRMAEQGLSGTTQLHCHRVLFMALKAAKRRRLLTYNPCEDIDATRKETAPVEPPTPEEVGRLIAAAADTRIDLLVRLLAYTGLRLGEALGLRWSDVELEAGVLHVRQTRKHGHAAPEYGQPKTERSRRSVSLIPELVSALREHRDRQLAFNLENGFFPTQDLVFTTVTRDGVTGMSHDQVSRTWARVRERARVPRVRIHDLRHFFATTLIAAKVPLPDVSAILGHGKTSTTADIYAHVIPGRGREAMAEIERALAGK